MLEAMNLMGFNKQLSYHSFIEFRQLHCKPPHFQLQELTPLDLCFQ